jgi:competence protein ComEC
LRLDYGKISFLLTGDISAKSEIALITDRAGLTSTVLKVAHHGSGASTSSEFLNVADPQIAVISVGKDNDYGHPDPTVLARLIEKLGGANVYRTDEDGTVEFITDGERLWVRTETP